MSDFVDFIEAAKVYNLVLEEECPYQLHELLYFYQPPANITELFAIGGSLVFTGFDEFQNSCSLQIAKFVNGMHYSQLERQLRVLFKAEANNSSFADLIRWPIYLLPRYSLEGSLSTTKLAIVTNLNTISLERMIEKTSLVASICSKQNLSYDEFVCSMFEQVIQALYEMHKMKVAHRNIRP